jgi:glutaconate CoA-transferase, subunit A
MDGGGPACLLAHASQIGEPRSDVRVGRLLDGNRRDAAAGVSRPAGDAIAITARKSRALSNMPLSRLTWPPPRPPGHDARRLGIIPGVTFAIPPPGDAMTDKRTTLADAIAAIPAGAVVALGGNTLHRGPAAAVHEIVRQAKRGLEIVKTAGAYDVDLLCGAGCVAAVSAGYVGFETPFGMAPSYRRAVEQGAVVAKEHACYSVIAGMRAAIQGVPFMPIAGFAGSDLPAARGFARVADPYGGGEVYVVPALTPDVAILHVHEADRLGNGRIVGSEFEDAIMARAARRVILTAERVVDDDAFAADPDATTIPGFMVDAVVEAPGGAWPLSCVGRYDFDAAYLADYVAASRDPDALAAFIRERILEPAAPATARP